MSSSQGFTEHQKHELKDFVDKASECYNIPGVSVSVIHDETKFSKGYGWADKENNVAVTNDTGFCIGSITKSFTTTLLSILLAKHEEYNWDTPAHQILPELTWNETYLVDHVTLRDLASHRLGLPRYDQMLISAAYTSLKQIASAMPFLTRTADIRTEFMYNNLAYMSLGLAAERIGGDTWLNLLRRHVTDPLGMDISVTNDMETTPNLARLYVQLNGSVTLDDQAPKAVAKSLIGPAGSICTSGMDMLKYLEFHLSEEHESVENGSSVDELYKAHISVKPGNIQTPEYPVTFTFPNYGLGMFIGSYRGDPAVGHGGTLFSFQSHMTLLRRHSLAVYISTNGPGVKQSEFMDLTASYIMDLALGKDPWLNTSTVCTFPEPWENKTRAVGPPIFNRNLTYTREPSIYEGAFGHIGLGYLYITYNKTSMQLQMKYGQTEFILWPQEADEFQAEVTGLLADASAVDVTEENRNKTALVNFLGEEGLILSVNTSFIQRDFAVFERDLDPSSRPKYPIDCKASTSGVEPRLRGIITTICMLLMNLFIHPML